MLSKRQSSDRSGLEIQLQAHVGGRHLDACPLRSFHCDFPKPASKTQAPIRIVPSVVEGAIELLTVVDYGYGAAAVRSVRWRWQCNQALVAPDLDRLATNISINQSL